MAVRAAKFWAGILMVCSIGLLEPASVRGQQPVPPSGQLGEYPSEAPPPPRHSVLQPGFPLPASPDPTIDLPPPSIPENAPPAAGLTPFQPQQQPLDPEVILPNGTSIPLPASARQVIRFSPRYEKLPAYVLEPTGPEERRLIFTGGVIVNVVYFPGGAGGPPQEIEFATDSVVAWMKGVTDFNPTGTVETNADGGKKKDIELFLSGDVVIRTLANGQGGVEQILRAEQIYYDVNRNRAVAMYADLEMRGAQLKDSVHMRGKEIWRLGKNEWRAFEPEISSSKRPSDPNLTLTSSQSTLTQELVVRRNIFGIPYRNLLTGEQEVGYERTLATKWSWLRVRDVPIIPFLPVKADADEPFGPLIGIGGGNDQIFGTQIFTTWDMYKLLARRPPPGHRWRLDADYLSDRGPALGTNYNYLTPSFFGLGQQSTGFVRLYGIQDDGVDQLGANRPDVGHPDFRGRAHWRHNQDLYEYGTTYVRVLAQAEYLSDKDFLEQFYKQEFDMGPNQDTFLHVYGARDNWYGSFLTQGRVSTDWWTQTEWLPRVDGAVVGETFLRDRLIYSADASAGYAQLRPATIAPLPILVSNAIPVNTGRFDLEQRLNAPFDAGPFRINPHGILDLTYYSEDIYGNDQSRIYGGGGASISATASRLYQEANSELFNVRGLYHKVTVTADYTTVRSNTPYYLLPQLDPLFDNAVDQGFRNVRPTPGIMYPPGTQGSFTYPDLGYAPSFLFNPQMYAIRRGVDNRTDTVDDMEIVRLDGRQRLQTKRGFQGAEHTVDWMTLNTGVSFFPNPGRDNYGSSWAFLDYLYLWHIGDRFSMSSAGWFDPFYSGAKYFNVGMYFNRPDNTNFSLTYRHTDPLQSRAVTAAINYQLSRRYAMNLGTAYDFGLNESLTNTISFARTGPDVTMMFGVSYNPLVNNFGIQFSLIPNIAAMGGTAGMRGFGSNSGMMAGR
ncbi:MAG: hypothetical protein LC104_09825 [Bacteroidales bacterium]|nr:hypothetical protein [Bacteroidales bacterium]